MKVWQGKLRLLGPVTRDGIMHPGEEVNARVVMGQTLVLYVSDCNDEFGKLMWSIGDVTRIYPYSMLKALAESTDKQNTQSNPVRLTNC